jgi:hypothetical protein
MTVLILKRMKETFENGLFTSNNWCYLIIDALAHVLVNGVGNDKEQSEEGSDINNDDDFHEA